MVRSLVLDQSTTTIGYAVVQEDPDTPVSFGVTGRLLSHGRTTTPAKAALVDRLQVIRADLKQLILRYDPEEIVVENTMFIGQRSGQTAHAMAAILATCQEIAKEHGLAFFSQNPSTIKKYVAGDGKADKEVIKAAVCKKWGLNPWDLKDDNHADALAGAFLWLYRGDEVRKAKAEKGRKKRSYGA